MRGTQTHPHQSQIIMFLYGKAACQETHSFTQFIRNESTRRTLPETIAETLGHIQTCKSVFLGKMQGLSSQLILIVFYHIYLFMSVFLPRHSRAVITYPLPFSSLQANGSTQVVCSRFVPSASQGSTYYMPSLKYTHPMFNSNKQTREAVISQHTRHRKI